MFSTPSLEEPSSTSFVWLEASYFNFCLLFGPFMVNKFLFFFNHHSHLGKFSTIHFVKGMG